MTDSHEFDIASSFPSTLSVIETFVQVCHVDWKNAAIKMKFC